MDVAPGTQTTVERVVEESDTASVVGSGDVPVLATPRLLALAEAATVALLARHLAPGWTTVGTRVELDHVRATPVGGKVTVRATLAEANGKRLRFEFEAVDGDGQVVGRGTVHRALVERERFLGPTRN
ncbi:thioesterase family protein [Longimycelium tulufanense]|nr:hotdog domain-containing protein [Longimycelium tulufanense]